MPLVASLQGTVFILSQAIAGFSDLAIHLYKNDVDITPETELEEFTECDFGGYAPIACNSWGAAFLDDEDRACSIHPNRIWTCNGVGVANEVYGYLIVYTPSNLLLWAEADPDGPAVISVAGQTFVVQPKICLRNPE